jgi:hypothetical protein
VSLATVAAIRDRVHALVETIAPTSHSGVKFLRVRNERDGNIEDWATKNPTACLRRFQARQVQTDEPPVTTSVVEERVMLNLELRVCYAQDGRFGKDNALDRDDVINQDWLKINAALGAYGRANFSSTNDCTPMPASMDMERVDGIDFMVVRLRYEYLRSVT